MRSPLRSEIFEAYEKIAEEKGWIKTAETIEQYKNESYPRAGSDTLEKIEKLYNTKPETPFKYERNIIELAHPNPVVIAPSYDKVNGLVENENERQNLTINMIEKPTDGMTTYHKYARQELMVELVRLATDLDNQGNEELRKLADDCLTELAVKKKPSDLTKTALVPLVLGGLAVVLGGLWLQQHLDDPDQGLKQNIANALSQLDDLKTNSWYESDVDETIQKEVDALEAKLGEFAPIADKFLTLVDRAYKPKSVDDKDELNKMTDSIPTDAHKIVEDFVNAVKNLAPSIVADIKAFSDRDYQLAHTKPSWIGNVSGRLGELFHGRWGLIANDFISTVNALNPLKESLARYYQKAQRFDEVKGEFQDQIEKTEEKGKDDKGTEDDSFWDKLTSFLGHKPSKEQFDFVKQLKD